MAKFTDLVNEQIERIKVRGDELLNIKKVLDERGETIEHALVTCKGTNDKIEDQGIELKDMVQLCHMTGVKLDLDT